MGREHAMQPPSPPKPLISRLSAETPRSALALAAGGTLLWLGQAFALADIISGWLGQPQFLPVSTAAVIFLALAVIRAAAGYWAEGALFDYAEEVIERLRSRFVQTESVRAFQGNEGSAALASLAGEKLEMLSPYLTRYAPARLRTMLLPLAILAVSFSISWAVGLIFLVSGPLIPVFMGLIGMAARDASARHLSELGSLNDLLSERLSALIDIRLLNAGDRVLSAFDAQTASLRSRTMSVLRIAFLSSTVLELFAAIGVAMVAVFVGFSLLGTISFGTYGAPVTAFQGIFLLLLAPEFYQPMRDLAAAWHDKAAAEAVIDEYESWEQQTGGGILGEGRAEAPLSGPAMLNWVNLNVLLPGGQTIAYPDFSIEPGTAVAVSGPSGAGKSTLLLALAGLMPDASGEVRVGDGTLTPANADAWRARLAFIPQHMRFLTGSLRHNITLGEPLDPGRLIRALEQAQVSDVVERAPRGLQTQLGETGGGLSGGEARRIAIARAIYAGADLVLADEPTADLDAETARLVTDGLLAMRTIGVTLIVSTHDPDLIARMDHVLELSAK